MISKGAYILIDLIKKISNSCNKYLLEFVRQLFCGQIKNNPRPVASPILRYRDKLKDNIKRDKFDIEIQEKFTDTYTNGTEVVSLK